MTDCELFSNTDPQSPCFGVPPAAPSSRQYFSTAVRACKIRLSIDRAEKNRKICKNALAVFRGSA